MKLSVSQQLKNFLRTNRGVFNSGELQRMEFLNKDGTRATGKSISRRLQELAENGEINVNHRNGSAEYSADPIFVPPKPLRFYTDPVTNERVFI